MSEESWYHFPSSAGEALSAALPGRKPRPLQTSIILLSGPKPPCIGRAEGLKEGPVSFLLCFFIRGSDSSTHPGIYGFTLPKLAGLFSVFSGLQVNWKELSSLGMPKPISQGVAIRVRITDEPNKALKMGWLFPSLV